MMDLLVQILGLSLLLAGLGVAYRVWGQRYPTDTYGKGLVMLIILTLLGGFIGALAWWWDDPRSFSWDLPPVASRLLAAAGWAYAVVCYSVLQSPTRRVVRWFLIMQVVYLLPLTLAIVLFHLDRFDWSAPITPAFFTIVALMLIPSLVYLYRQPTLLADTPSENLSPSRLVQIWLGLVGIVTGLWGLALFSTASGFSKHIWLWQADLLTSRLIAVMLLTIAATTFYGLTSRRLARLTLLFAGVYGTLGVVAMLWNTFADKPIAWSYVSVLSVMALGSWVLFWRE